MTAWRFGSATDTGRVREANEDSLYVDSGIALVADGMGGHAAGEVASELAISVYRRYVEANRDTVLTLEDGVTTANEAILADARAHPDREGMGTTLVGVVLDGPAGGVVARYVNIGDSRLYRVRHGEARQLTDDDSVAEEWVREGRISKAEAAIHPRRHQLTKVLGMDPLAPPVTGVLSLEVGDRLVLCSDGLTNEVSDEDLATLAMSSDDLNEVALSLVHAANQAGGRDNISVVVLEITSVDLIVEADVEVAHTSRSTVRDADTVIRRKTSLVSRINWRLGSFVAALAVLVWGVFVVLGWYATSSYYLAENQGFISVYQGHPHGFLWYSPSIVMTTQYASNELTPADAASLRRMIVEPSLSAATVKAYNMHEAWLRSRDVTTGP